MSFANPGYLFLLLLLLPIIGWYVWEMHKSDASLQIGSTQTLRRQPKTLRIYLRHVPFVLRCATVVLLTIALARPQLTNRWNNEQTEGIDIVMALDVSGTMLAEDFRPNRLEAAKEVATRFVSERPNDNIGLVLFAGESYTQCPLTTDHTVLANLFRSVRFGVINDGTAIGLGLANAVNCMKDSPTKSKVIILLTDGSNNCGDIDPITAADIAKTFGIRVYAIGVGSLGEARCPVPTPNGTQYGVVSGQFDESTLAKIASITGGKYFRATGNKALEQVYEEIDQLEKSKIRVREYAKKTEGFPPYLWAAALCLILDILLRFFALRTISN